MISSNDADNGMDTIFLKEKFMVLWIIHLSKHDACALDHLFSKWCNIPCKKRLIT